MLDKLQWLYKPTPAAALFGLRTALAGLLALYLSMLLQLAEPKWALMTVFIVAQPMSGMVLAKGAARLAGTLVAAFGAIVLISLFGQNQVLFVAALALWLGLCVFCATLARNFRSYGFVLAGYTTAIIAAPATLAPETVFNIAVARTTEISLGIACAALSAIIFSRQVAGRAYFSKLTTVFGSIGTYLGELTGLYPGSRQDQVRALITDVLQLETLRGYARFDTPGFQNKSRLAQRLNHELLSLLTAAFSVQQHLRHDSPDGTLKPVLSPAGEALRPAARLLTEHASLPIDALKRSLTQAYDRILAYARLPALHPDPDEWMEISRLLDLANRLHAATVMCGLLQHDHPSRGQPRPHAFSIGVDSRKGLRNAVRALFSVACTAAIWFHTNAESGIVAIILVCVFVTLFSTRPDPLASLIPFVKGTVYAAIAAFAYAFFLLPLLHGFAFLAIALFPALFAGSMAKANPVTAGTGSAFLILFAILLGLSNTGRPLVPEFMNSLLGIALALAVLFVFFKVLWPADARTDTRRLLDAMFIELTGAFDTPRHTFETRMYDLLVRLLPYLDDSRRRDRATRRGALAAITVGMEGIRLRGYLRSPAIPQTARAQGASLLQQLSEYFSTTPGDDRTLRYITARAETLGRQLLAQANEMDDRDQRRVLVRAGVTVQIMATAVNDNAGFFSTRGQAWQMIEDSGTKEQAHAL